MQPPPESATAEPAPPARSYAGLSGIPPDRQVNLETVVPLAAWLRDRPWRYPGVRWFLFFAVFPLVLGILYGEGSAVGPAAWALGVYFSLMWLLLLGIFMRPDDADTSLLVQVGGFTAVVGIFSVLILQQLPGLRSLYAATVNPNPIPRWIGSVFGVGLVEEGAKLLPIVLFLFLDRRAYKPLTYSYAGVVSGLAFGVEEAVRYSYRYAHGVELHQLNLGDYIVIQLLRLITLPLLHACFCGISSYFVGLAALRRTAAPELILTGFFFAALLHGTYDTFASGVAGIAVAVLTMLIFISYVRTGDAIWKELVAESDCEPPTECD